jgi:hypothetical protein
VTRVEAILASCFFFVLFLLAHYFSAKAGRRLGDVTGRVIFAPLVYLVKVRRRRRAITRIQEQRQAQGLPPIENPDLE